jgi:hypothetical protein
MDCQERLLEQARMTKERAASLGIEQKVWVYRNLVKALPWYSLVREKLNDTAYAGFFLKFNARCVTTKKATHAVVLSSPACMRCNPPLPWLFDTIAQPCQHWHNSR